MKYKLNLIDNSLINEDVYNMYQDIPKEERGSNNIINGATKEEFEKIMNNFITEQTVINTDLNTTTNRYIFYVNNEAVGEVGIRTILNQFWCDKGSQIFYKIRLSQRGKGYGNKLLELAINECRKLGFKRVRINCDDNNFLSKKIIIKNGGKINIESYKTSNGYSSSYIIDLEN